MFPCPLSSRTPLLPIRWAVSLISGALLPICLSSSPPPHPSAPPLPLSPSLSLPSWGLCSSNAPSFAHSVSKTLPPLPLLGLHLLGSSQTGRCTQLLLWGRLFRGFPSPSALADTHTHIYTHLHTHIQDREVGLFKLSAQHLPDRLRISVAGKQEPLTSA